MKLNKIIATGATVTAAVGMAAAGFASSAGAATTGCAHSNDNLANSYCGAIVSAQAPHLAMGVAGQSTKAGTKVIASPNVKGDAGTDLAIFQGQENTTTWADQSVSFEFAPNGKFSGMVVTEPSSHSGLVLERGNGSANQEFAMTADGSYTNLATGDVISIGVKGSQLHGITTPKPLTGAQEFHQIVNY